MAAPQEKLYQVSGNLVTFGKKHIMVRDPQAMTDILKSGTQYVPIANYNARSRDEDDASNVVTFFKIFVMDKFFIPTGQEKPKLLDVQITIPEQFTPYLSLVDGQFKLDPRKDLACQQYIEHLNELINCWFPIISQKRDNALSPVSFRYLQQPAIFKWPWKKETAEEYIDRFSTHLNTHVLMLGVGWHNGKNSEIGLSMNLSQYPGLSYAGVLEKMNSQKKRKIVSLDENGEEISSEAVDSEVVCSVI